MTFEETIIFYNPEHADEFTLRLKKSGFKAKTKRVSTLVKETVCTGKIEDFVSLFKEEKGKFENSDDKTDVQALMSDMYNEIIDELELRKTKISEFFNSAEPGDCISDLPGFSGCDGWITAGNSENSNEHDENKAIKTLFYLLTENNLLENNDGKWILKNTADPGEIMTAVPSDMMLEASSQEKREKYNIKTIINVMSGIETHITLPPEFSIAAEPEMIDELMEKYDVDEDSIWMLKENGYIKSLLADQIIEYLKKNERTSFDDLFGELKNLKFSIDSTNDEFRFDIDEKFLKDLLGDMKKMDLIKSKGNHFRPASI